MPDKKIDPLLVLPRIYSKPAPGDEDAAEPTVIQVPMKWDRSYGAPIQTPPAKEVEEATVRFDLFGLIRTINEEESWFDTFPLPLVYPKAWSPAWEAVRSWSIAVALLLFMVVGMSAAPPVPNPQSKVMHPEPRRPFRLER